MHLWRARLDRAGTRLAELARDLDRGELERAARMRFEHLRDAALISAAFLRRVLASYVGVAPADLAFERGPHGKPVLRVRGARAMPHFNLSHSGNLALVAVCAEREVGVDLEEIRPAGFDELLLERVLVERERALFETAPAVERARLFYALWTHKEAAMKATGQGLALDPQDLEVLLPGLDGGARLATLVETPSGPHALEALDVAPTHVAALALPGPAARTRRWLA